MDNFTFDITDSAVTEDGRHKYTAEEITLMLGGLGGMLASLIYALKNVKHFKSGCMECDQKIKDDCPDANEPHNPIFKEMSNV